MPAECLARVRAPIGLAIGAVTPAEIAISIVAEMIAVHRGVETNVVSMTGVNIERRDRRRNRADPSSFFLPPSSFLFPLPSLLIRNAVIVTMNDRLEIVEGDVVVRDGRIDAVGTSGGDTFDRVIDAAGGYLLPGFIQTHVHLCQTLFRGFADDMTLLEWLRRRVWPMEAAHTDAVAPRLYPARVRRAAALGHDRAC